MKHSSKLILALLYLGLSACVTDPVPTIATGMTSYKPAVRQATDDSKGDPQKRFASALKLMQDGRSDEAKIALQVLSQDFPQFSGPATNLGILCAKTHDQRGAIAAFNAAIKAKPDNAVALNWLGQLSREQGNNPQAEQYYQRAIAAQPDYAPAHFNLAILYDVALRRPERALDQYRAYQKLVGAEQRPMVGVWIHELESRTVVAAGASSAPAGAQK